MPHKILRFVCGSCGEELTNYPSDAKFCGKCGHQIRMRLMEEARKIFGDDR